METHRLVLPEDLNQFGYLFGGRLLAWIDEACWIAASLDFPEARFVTVAMNEVVFRHSVKKGTILAIESRLKKEGATSATYSVIVRRGRAKEGEALFTTQVTLVNIDEEGIKKTLR